jgi:hypothetical protein
MRVPYNNGKVLIGSRYEPPKYVEQDSDMLQIQGWFIGDNKAARRNYWANVAYMVVLVVAVILGIIYT